MSLSLLKEPGVNGCGCGFFAWGSSPATTPAVLGAPSAATEAALPPSGTGWGTGARFHQHRRVSRPTSARRDVLVRGFHALSGPCCAGTMLLHELTNKLNRLNCFKFGLFKGPFTVVRVPCSYSESFNCSSLGIFCFVMLMRFLFDLFSQRILANSMVPSAPGGLFRSGATTAFLGSKPGFFWSSECICICSLVFFFPYLCLCCVTIQGVPALVPYLYGAQKMTPLWTCGLGGGGGQKVPERVARDCCKDLNVVFCSPKQNSCCRSSYMLK